MLCTHVLVVLFLSDSMNIVKFCDGFDSCVYCQNLSIAEQCCNLSGKLQARLCWISRTVNLSLLVLVVVFCLILMNEAFGGFFLKKNWQLG